VIVSSHTSAHITFPAIARSPSTRTCNEAVLVFGVPLYRAVTARATKDGAKAPKATRASGLRQALEGPMLTRGKLD
jgi:hypothetical protein